MAKKKLNFTVLDIEDIKMTGNRAYDLTRPRKGFAINLIAKFSIDKNYCLAFKKYYGITGFEDPAIEVEDSINFLIKNSGVILYPDFQRLIGPDFISVGFRRKNILNFSNYPTLRTLYKKIDNFACLLSTNNTFSQSNFFELYLKANKLKCNNYTILCNDRFIPVVDNQLLLNADEDNQIAYFESEDDLLQFIKKQIYNKYKDVDFKAYYSKIKYNSNNQFGYDYYMAYINRITFEDFIKLESEQKLSITNEYEDNTKNTEIFDITNPDDLLETINTSFFLTDAHFTETINPFNVSEIIKNRTLYNWEEPYNDPSLTTDDVKTFKRYFFGHICDTFITDEKQVYDIKQIF